MNDKTINEIIEGLQFIETLFVRYNDWTKDHVPGFPLEICRHGNEFESDEVIVLRRYPVSSTECLADFKLEQQIAFLRQKLIDNN